MMTQDEVFEMLIRWGQAHDSLRAMLLTSSRAVANAPVDLFSDYDVILVVRDIRLFYEDRSWLEDFGRVLAMYRDPIQPTLGHDTFGDVTQYESGLKIDFGVWPVETLRRLAAEPALQPEFDAGYRVLLDKDGLTAAMPAPAYRGYIPAPPVESEYLETIESFLLDTIYIAKYLWRDDLVAAKNLFDQGLIQEYLRPMLIWRMEIDCGWTLKPGPYGRRLQRDLRPDLWAELKGLYCGPGREENWDALFRALALFRRVSIETGDRLGFAYPHDKERRVLAYLHKVRALKPNARQFE